MSTNRNVLTAHIAHNPANGTANAYFLDNSAVNRKDNIPVALTNGKICPCLEPVVIVTQSRFLTVNFLNLTAENSCRLIFGTRIVVNNSRLADKKLFKLIKRIRCKAFAVTVNIIVTQHNRKRIHLIFCKISPCKAVNQFEFIIADSLIFTVNNARNTAFNKFVILHSAPPLQSVFQCSSHLHC